MEPGELSTVPLFARLTEDERGRLADGPGGARILGRLRSLMGDAGRASAAHMIETEASRVLLDCGTGTLHGFAYADSERWFDAAMQFEDLLG